MARILFCDDDRKMLETLGTYLSWYGLDVDISDDPFEVPARLAQHDYGLLICSAWMQSMDGFSLCESLRRSGDTSIREIKILMVAPENMDHEQYKLLRQNDIYFMTKYKSPEKWFEKITTIFHKRNP